MTHLKGLQGGKQEDTDVQVSTDEETGNSVMPIPALSSVNMDNTTRKSEPQEFPIISASQRDAATGKGHPAMKSQATQGGIHMDSRLPTYTKEEILETRLARKHHDKRCACIMVQLGLLAVVVAIVLVIMNVKQQEGNSKALATEKSKLLDLKLPLLTQQAMQQDSDSPQTKAYQWLIQDNSEQKQSFSEDQALQRYALATLFFGTGGATKTWNVNSVVRNDYLAHHKHECYWLPSKISCNDQLQVTKIELQDFGLTGKLPPEIFLLLPQLRLLDVSHNMALSGSLPFQFTAPPDFHLVLKETNISGVILDSICGIDRLEFTCNPAVLCGCGCACFSVKAEGSPVLRDFVSSLPMYSENSLFDAITPQSKALNWILEDPNVDSYAASRRLQRFALATIFFATGVNNQTDHASADLLSYDTHECDWDCGVLNFTCNQGTRQVSHLKLGPAELGGFLPPELALLTSLVAIDISGNALTGLLPTELGLLSQLEAVDASSNQFSGSIPFGDWHAMTKLLDLDLFDNRLNEPLETHIGGLRSLTHLRLANNDIAGSFPSEIGLLTNLYALDMSWNYLIEAIPSTIGQLIHLRMLRLNDNRFRSSIPIQVGYLRELRALYVHDNDMLEGRIPNVLTALPYFESLTVNKTFISGLIPSKLCELELLDYNCSAFLCGCSDCLCEDQQ